MGADMDMCGIPTMGPLTLEQRKEILINKINSYSENEISGDLLKGFWYEGSMYQESPKHMTLDQKKKFIIESISKFFESVDSREVVYWTIPGGLFYVTGGMSHGEPATEAFPLFCMIEALPRDALEAAKMIMKNPYELFVDEYESNMSEILKKELLLLKGALKI